MSPDLLRWILPHSFPSAYGSSSAVWVVFPSAWFKGRQGYTPVEIFKIRFRRPGSGVWASAGTRVPSVNKSFVFVAFGCVARSVMIPVICLAKSMMLSITFRARFVCFLLFSVWFFYRLSIYKMYNDKTIKWWQVEYEKWLLTIQSRPCCPSVGCSNRWTLPWPGRLQQEPHLLVQLWLRRSWSYVDQPPVGRDIRGRWVGYSLTFGKWHHADKWG